MSGRMEKCEVEAEAGSQTYRTSVTVRFLLKRVAKSQAGSEPCRPTVATRQRTESEVSSELVAEPTRGSQATKVWHWTVTKGGRGSNFLPGTTHRSGTTDAMRTVCCGWGAASHTTLSQLRCLARIEVVPRIRGRTTRPGLGTFGCRLQMVRYRPWDRRRSPSLSPNPSPSSNLRRRSDDENWIL